MKLKKEDVFKLLEYQKLQQKISDRFSEIIDKISTNDGWYDYDNGHGETDGHFDIRKYREYIYIDGDVSIPEPYRYAIPTHWLWEDFEEEFKRNVEKETKKSKKKKKK